MTDHYQEYWTRADFIDAPTAEADELRAENERLRAALEEARYVAHSVAHSEFDGVWFDSDFAELTPLADAILARP